MSGLAEWFGQEISLLQSVSAEWRTLCGRVTNLRRRGNTLQGREGNEGSNRKSKGPIYDNLLRNPVPKIAETEAVYGEGKRRR